MHANDNDAVTDSCGCVFCDLDLAIEYVGNNPVHVVNGRTIDGTVETVPCTKPATVAKRN